jgi:hypothetical protein
VLPSLIPPRVNTRECLSIQRSSFASVQSSRLPKYRKDRPSFQTPVSHGAYLASSCSVSLRRPLKLSLNTSTLDYVIPRCLERSRGGRPRTTPAYECIRRCIPTLEERRLWRFVHCRSCHGMVPLGILCQCVFTLHVEIQIAEGRMASVRCLRPGCCCSSHSVSGTNY